MMRRILLAALPWALLGGAILDPGAASRAASGYMVQLASVRSEDAARKEWERLQRVHPDLLGDLELALQRADLGERGVFFRIRTGPFPNKATAEDMCWQIKAAELACLVVYSE